MEPYGYGKSIRKEQVEDDFAALARELTPAPQLIKAAKAMFSKIWDVRCEGLKSQHEKRDDDRY